LYGALDPSVDPARFAVTLTYVISSGYNLTLVLPWISVIEQELNSVERLKHYCQLESEAAPCLPSDPPALHWPSRGAISFSNVELRYRPDLALVLKKLSFEVQAGEKVGVIGRTGAGKSSLVNAIYRAVELAGGSIKVDGQDLGALGLRTVGRQAYMVADCSAPRADRNHPARTVPLWRNSPTQH
jgi:ABC-type multidrug transport system fused ATPase/permease subunit